MIAPFQTLLRAFETIRCAGSAIEDFAPLAATQLRYVLDGVASTKTEVATDSFPRGPANLTEHTPVLDRLVQLRLKLRLGDGDLARVQRMIRARIAPRHEHDGFNIIVADAV